MYSARLVLILNEIAYRYKGIIQRAVHEVLTQPKYTNTGAGAASVTVVVVDGDQSKSPVIQITFDEHIKFLDKRKLQWTKMPNMQKLLEWAATKTDNPKAAKKLAFAVGWQQRNYDTWKSKPWRKKSLSVVLKELNTLVLAEFDRAIEQDILEAAA